MRQEGQIKLPGVHEAERYQMSAAQLRKVVDLFAKGTFHDESIANKAQPWIAGKRGGNNCCPQQYPDYAPTNCQYLPRGVRKGRMAQVPGKARTDGNDTDAGEHASPQSAWLRIENQFVAFWGGHGGKLIYVHRWILVANS